MIRKISKKHKKELAEYAKIMKEMEDVIFCQNWTVIGGICFSKPTSHHHIVYRSEAPKHENLHNKRNVIKLCNECHSNYHNRKDNRKHLVIERKLWELFPELRLKERYMDSPENILYNCTKSEINHDDISPLRIES